MLLLFSSLCLFQYDYFAVAAPVQNLTALNTEIAPAWVADPAGRGTWDILYSCTFTIFLCVYTAIHLNVPPEESEFRYWLRKTKWVFIAIVAPEIVLYTAFEQWFLSRSFLRKLNKFVDETSDEKTEGWVNSYNFKSRFDMVYAQYAVMGGFAADIQHLHNAITERVTITSDGVLFMAKHGLFCQIRRDDIQDKSKADILAKGLVCVQVLWVAGQAIERKLAGFPITLLEVHTLVHVVCAIIMYALWIRKPLNVKDPTIVDFRDASEALAFMVEHSRQLNSDAGLGNRPGFKLENDEDQFINPEPNLIWYKDPSQRLRESKIDRPNEHFEIESPLGPSSLDPIHEQVQISTLYCTTHDDMSGITHYYAAGCHSFPLRYRPISNMGITCRMVSGQTSSRGYGPGYGPRYDPGTEGLQTIMILLSEKDVLRLNLTADFLTKLKLSTAKSKLVSEDSQNRVFLYLKEIYTSETGQNLLNDLLQIRAPNFKGDVWVKIEDSASYFIVALALIPAAYGCIHIGALSLTFPSLVERLLWKISCYCLIVAAIFVGILGLQTYITHIVPDSAGSLIRRYTTNFLPGFFFLVACWDWILIIILGLFAPVYVGARLFIVVESFISLRYVPIGVYETPDINFMNYIPHL